MKIRKFAVAALASMMSLAACTQTPANLPDGRSAKGLLPTKAQTDSVSYLLGINFGSFIKGYNFGSDLNYSQIVEGMKDFVASEGDQTSEDFVKQFKIDPNTMNDLFNTYLEKRAAYDEMLAEAEQNKFFAENLKKDGVQQTESGLQYLITEQGNGEYPSLADTVVVNYKGTLLDGTVFDENDAIDFPLNRVIPGWQEGIQLISVGGKATLYVPSKLGYGSQNMGTIPANSVLVFDVELVDIHKAAIEE